MLEKTGVPTQSEIESVFPDSQRLSKGPVAIIECFQSIPCDPCEKACPRGAIQPFADINHRPVIDNDKCNGCILCMTKCPGLAIMVVDMTYAPSHALIKMPYEFRPLPEKGQTVQALDREGNVIAEAEVVQVLNTKKMNNVPIVSISVDKQLVKQVRNIREIKAPAPTPTGAAIQEVAQDTGITCRCNDLDISEIRALIASGYTTIQELKQMARIGMGPCQGRSCLPIVINELSRALGIPVSKLPPSSFRPMVKSIELGDLAAYEDS